jgi:6-phosphogluconolactonase/glucosamine-6-phosphate isomerase/deaminase
MNGRVEVVASVADAFAGLVTDQLAGPRTGGFSFFLSGGSSAGDAYRRLAETSAAAVDWTTVDAYWGDERCVSIDDEDSNYRLCHQTLLDRVGPLHTEHPMYRSGTPEDAAADYQAQLEALSSFDLIHLGMGPDGHTASLFPESDALAIDDPDVLVVANRDPLASPFRPSTGPGWWCSPCPGRPSTTPSPGWRPATTCRRPEWQLMK